MSPELIVEELVLFLGEVEDDEARQPAAALRVGRDLRRRRGDSGQRVEGQSTFAAWTMRHGL